ncbi:MAG: hypothetical protein KGL48_05760 [Sphingomonadales bacterium]|nr:hypothetical protein [Sphingomonadales bacterium]MDE2569772.1 hypothetical protein [Sphingomonadales bacterium]
MAVLLAAMLFAWFTPAQAANCYSATAQGSTGPSDFATYCWIDFSTYNDTSARSTSGQSFSLVLQDGSTMTFRMKVSGAAIYAATAPSWSGAAVGNTAFLGIAGRPIVYQSAAGTTTVTFSSISITPPAGVQAVTQYMFVAGDGESTNNGESLSFNTNGSGWTMLDQAGPISGSTYPSTSGTGTQTFTETGVAGTVGAYIVGSSTPTSITTTLVGGGLQGAMFAVRFATIQLNTLIGGARVDPADQFTFSISATSNGAVISSGTSSGTGLGPFTAATLASTSSVPITLSQAIASGSASALSDYQSKLTCTNASSTSTPMPTNVTTASYNFGALQYGDTVSCYFTETPFPHLQLTKALGSYRRFSSDQFTMKIDQGTTTVATTTTTGTGNVVTNASTPNTLVTAGTQYSLYEVGAGATSLNEYSATMACANANAGSSTSLPSDPANAKIRPALGDVIGCTITNTRLASNARLTIAKTSIPVSDPVNGTTNPKIVPGAIVRYTFAVSNTGNLAVDSGTVWLIDQVPAGLSVGTAASPVFTDGSPSSGLTFTASTDLRYSNATTMPTSFAACTYTPTAAYDPNVHYVCLNPKGTMAASTGTPPSFTLSINARVN